MANSSSGSRPGGKPQNVPQRKRYDQKPQKYSEKYGSNRPNPYTGYLPPNSQSNKIYHPEAVDTSKLAEISKSSTGLTEAVMEVRGKPEPPVPAPSVAATEQKPAASVQQSQQKKREYSPNRKKNRSPKSEPNKKSNEELRQHMKEIQQEAAAETVTSILSDNISSAAQSTSQPNTPASPEIRLSPDGQPLVAIPVIGDDGKSEIRWLPIAVPSSEKPTANVAAGYADFDFDSLEADENPFDLLYNAPVVQVDVDLDNSKKATTENETADENTSDEKDSDDDDSTAVIPVVAAVPIIAGSDVSGDSHVNDDVAAAPVAEPEPEP
ncbi:MAG: hypothetical protein J6L81_07790, partial [Clostridia bacterium]|nr:hypothetical protein [Clostridia bacterium]